MFSSARSSSWRGPPGPARFTKGMGALTLPHTSVPPGDSLTTGTSDVPSLKSDTQSESVLGKPLSTSWLKARLRKLWLSENVKTHRLKAQWPSPRHHGVPQSGKRAQGRPQTPQWLTKAQGTAQRLLEGPQAAHESGAVPVPHSVTALRHWGPRKTLVLPCPGREPHPGHPPRAA